MKDSFGREITYLRLSVTDRCNLRCRYCMPKEGIALKPHSEMLTEEETICAVSAAAELGINKIRITGGEPLVKRNILSICSAVSSLPGITELDMTTNGICLPLYARDLKAAGVKRLNISLDTLDEKKYEQITRVGRLSDALKGIETALESGFERIKINTVLIGGFNDDEIGRLAELTIRYPIDLRFIELMPMRDFGFTDKNFISDDYVLNVLSEAKEELSDGVARLYRLPDAMGRIGLISPLSHAFCGSCNRLRLTADGKIKPCLHSSEEYSLKGLDKEAMKEVFITAINAKPECHGKLSSESFSESLRGMSAIGG